MDGISLHLLLVVVVDKEVFWFLHSVYLWGIYDRCDFLSEGHRTEVN